jgi:hypothetical protein
MGQAHPQKNLPINNDSIIGIITKTKELMNLVFVSIDNAKIELMGFTVLPK